MTTQPSLGDTPEIAAEHAMNDAGNAISLMKWAKRGIYYLLDAEEVRKDRNAQRELHLEKTRALRLSTDREERASHLARLDQESKIKARLVLSLQRLKDIFIELRKDDPEMMKNIAFLDFLNSCTSFLDLAGEANSRLPQSATERTDEVL